MKEKRFGFEPEITAKLTSRGARIYEVGVSYYGRTYEDGKKLAGKTEFVLFIASLNIVLQNEKI